MLGAGHVFCIARSRVQIPLKSWIFFRLLLRICINCVHNCQDHSSLDKILLLISQERKTLRNRTGNSCNTWKSGITSILSWPGPNTVKWMSISSTFYLQQAQKVIESHNASTPLFLYLPFQSVHTPLQVPTEYTEKYENIKDDDRKSMQEWLKMLMKQ